MPDPHTALLLIDVQQAFDDHSAWGGARNHPQAEANIARLLQTFRESGLMVVHVRHASTTEGSPLAPDQPGYRVKPEAAERPGEPVIVKHVNSAFIGTSLHEQLQTMGIRSLVIVGATTDHCCSTTTRMAANLGYQVTFVDDATWTYDKRHPDGQMMDAELVHRVNVASLSGEFADIVMTDDLLAGIRAGGS
ncbi:cysteine hydrolase family protein [Deinococcus hohokamensis]|uniref:Cysteine hydrolase family protein n=1 Tax=Deinococcus hohokamensis TaxID=309883 RepID=A0ABV9I6I5_9DEIO